ncbi:FlhC family transcriptional regulator [Photorhabdus luminescens]|uniref:Transcriptional regulator n=1 Tax=Photorhabdus luminescens subsp. mexicana TaxID=2100167 RepID=A0A4R4IXX8_PHOLU|nr:FlhC family transcriptional regulator [Photorhabdus luminescens]TDB45582.1 transcriptional regulator [Photorhabdus luminescens subsp. mexicana]
MKAALVKDEDVYAMTQRMVKLGFRKKVIIHSLNTSDRLIDYLKKEFGSKEVSIGRLKQSETFLSSTAKKVEATNFMSIYLRKAKDPANTNNILDVVDSFEIYRELNIKFRPTQAQAMMLDPNEAWILARDFRSEEIRMVKCSKCGMYFISLYSYERAYKKHQCPFCTEAEVNKERQKAISR